MKISAMTPVFWVASVLIAATGCASSTPGAAEATCHSQLAQVESAADAVSDAVKDDQQKIFAALATPETQQNTQKFRFILSFDPSVDPQIIHVTTASPVLEEAIRSIDLAASTVQFHPADSAPQNPDQELVDAVLNSSIGSIVLGSYIAPDHQTLVLDLSRDPTEIEACEVLENADSLPVSYDIVGEMGASTG